ncbi:hypothetical protein H4R27_001087 [Coemansia aciculifera]|nr:hypothetical protein H4R27_001087 [Coemansia aciculifera]
MSKDASSGQALPPRERHSMPENTSQPGRTGSTQLNERFPPPYAQKQQPNQALGSGSNRNSDARLVHTNRRRSDGASSLPPQPSTSTGGGFKKLMHAVGDHTFRSSRRKSIESAKHALSGLFRRSSRESIHEHPPDRTLPTRREEGPSDGSNDRARAYLEIDTDSSDSSKKDTCSKEAATDEFTHKSSARLASASFLDSDSNEDADDDSAATTSPGREATFTVEYEAEPAPGNWGRSQTQNARTDPGRPNMPLEPEEYTEVSVPWFVKQMGMGEQPLSSLFRDELSDGGSSADSMRFLRLERQRRKKLAFGVLKKRVGEARVGIPRQPPMPTKDDFKRKDGTVDYVTYGCSRIKHYADTQLSHKLDYRHDSNDPCKLDRFIVTLQRLAEVSAPYQRLIVWLYKLARWDNPRLTIWWCFVYFLLLYFGMLSAFLWLTPVFVVAYYRLRPSQAYQWLAFERPETSIIPSKVLQDASSGTLAKGLVANQLWDIWRETLGTHLHLILADVADWMERAKNCATWRRPWASRTVSLVMVALALFVYLVPAHVFQRLLGLCVGVQFFFLAPLQLRYQRYRHMLWVFDCFLWHCPTDVELAVETLYTQGQDCDTQGKPLSRHRSTNEQTPAKRGFVAHVRTLLDDMVYAYHPFPVDHPPPITILQTASSTALDRLGDDSADTGGVYDALMAGKRLGRKIIGDSSADMDEVEQYFGLGATRDIHLPSMMEQSEEQEWIRQLKQRQRRVSHAHSLSSSKDGEPEDSQPRPTRLRHTHRLSLVELPEAGSAGSNSSNSSGATEEGSSGSTSPDWDSTLMSRAKGLANMIRRRKSQASTFTDDNASILQGAPPIALRHSIAVQPTDLEISKNHLPSTMSLGLTTMGGSGGIYSSTVQEAGAQVRRLAGLASSSEVDLNTRQSIDSLLESIDSGRLELTREMKELAALRNKDARPAKDGVDLNSLYAFRCIHRGKYGTLFVTQEKFVFRRSRIMGGRRSKVSSYCLGSVVAIRKAAGHFGKSHGIQLLLRDGDSLSFYGLGSRDDIFGFLLVRCGNSHVY